MGKLAAARNLEHFTNLPLTAWNKWTSGSGGRRLPKPVIFRDTRRVLAQNKLDILFIDKIFV
jgi:hypothetical protein